MTFSCKNGEICLRFTRFYTNTMKKNLKTETFENENLVETLKMEQRKHSCKQQKRILGEYGGYRQVIFKSLGRPCVLFGLAFLVCLAFGGKFCRRLLSLHLCV